MHTGEIAYLALVFAAFSSFAISLSLVTANYVRWQNRQPAIQPQVNQNNIEAPAASLKLAA